MTVVTTPAADAGDAGSGDGGGNGGTSGGGNGGGGAPGPMTSWNAATLVVAVVVVGIILIALAVASPTKPGRPEVPNLITDRDSTAAGGGMGLQYAENLLASKNWKTGDVYDAMGEDRGVHDAREWFVCFQDPQNGSKEGKRSTDRYVDIGVVKLDEACPRLVDGRKKDFGALEQIFNSSRTRGTNTVPDLTGFTPFMARQAFGEDASIRVLKLPVKESRTKADWLVLKLEKLLDWNDTRVSADADTVSGDPGDWVICTQSLRAGDQWSGRVLSLWAIPVADVPARGSAPSVCNQLLAGQSTTPAPTTQT